jgi:hypothetical protein
MSAQLTDREARAAVSCARAIVRDGYKARLRADTTEFVEAVAVAVSELAHIPLDDARRLLVAKHHALLDLADERAVDLLPWLPPRITTPRASKAEPSA